MGIFKLAYFLMTNKNWNSNFKKISFEDKQSYINPVLNLKYSIPLS